MNDAGLWISFWISESKSSAHDRSFQEQMAESAGYGMETHVARTSDGYLLKVHRLMVPYKSPGSPAKGPVLLMHGIFGASDNWILSGPRKALGEFNKNILTRTFIFGQ